MKTCVNGHPQTLENTRARSAHPTLRICRLCEAESHKRSNARIRAMNRELRIQAGRTPDGCTDIFLYQRIKFCKPDGTEHQANSGAPPVLAAFGDEDARRLQGSGIAGCYVTGWRA